MPLLGETIGLPLPLHIARTRRALTPRRHPPTSQTVPNVAAGFNVPRDVYYGEPALDAPAATSNDISPGRRARVTVEGPSRRAARLE